MTLRGVMTPGTVGVMTPTEKAPRCTNSDRTQSIEGDIVVDGAWRPRWAYDTHTMCLACGNLVKFRVRGTDTPRWARIMPHRTDGTPCR